MTNANRTQGPWHIGMKPGPIIYGPKGEQVADMRSNVLLADDENSANVAHIVRCVNAMPDLVAALEYIISPRGQLPGSDAIQKARAALARAKEST